VSASQLANKMSQIEPPDAVIGMTDWQEGLFNRQISVPCIRVKNKHLSFITSQSKEVLLKLKKVQPIIDDGETDRRTILFNPDQVKVYGDVPESVRTFLAHIGEPEDLSKKEVSLTVENFQPKSMLNKVLRSTDENVTGFTLVGHIAHLNLKENLLPFKTVIGEILLKLPNVKTVVNKTNVIDNTYRNFEMEVLAGEADNYVVSIKENKVKFELDFSKVYWNSRLSTEHERLVKKIRQGEVFYDVFAGVGPFAVPAAGKKAKVFANDLNPESYKWLKRNMEINKLANANVYNLDGKEFIQTIIKEGLEKWLDTCRQNGQEAAKVHIAMNLPGTAIDFLGGFKGLLKNNEGAWPSKLENFPVVYVYAFSSDEDAQNGSLLGRCTQSIGAPIHPDDVSIDFVRNVAPKKNMFRVTFHLNPEILTGRKLDSASGDEDDIGAKRQKIEQ